MDIIQALADLANEQPIFSGEADFQHALAWQLHLQDPQAKIRLEHRLQSTRMYLDITVESGNKRTAIELKYKTRGLETTVDGEPFWLANHGAQDCGRYDVLKDIERLEHVVDGEHFHEGFLIFLTNDPHYFMSRGEGRETIDQQFRLTQGRILHGEHKWSEAAGTGTTKGREAPIRLTGHYQLNWTAYSKLEASLGEFQMIIVPVSPNARAALIPVIQSVSEPSVRQVFKFVGGNGIGLLASQIPSDDTTHFSKMISKLAAQRPVLRSQHDLRDALSELLRSHGWKVTTNRELGTGLKTDIWAEAPGQANLAIEVRYKTSLLRCTSNDESYELKNQAAQDISRYDYLSDIHKVEQIVANRPGIIGYSIMITNDHLYWQRPTKRQSVDEDFLLYDGRTVTGTLDWSEHAGFGTVNGRGEPIRLMGAYRLNWQDYTNIPGHKNGLFRVLYVQIGGGKDESVK